MLAPSSSQPQPRPIRSIVLLAIVAFAAQSMVRVTDSLLPEIALDFSTTVGMASIVVSGYAVAHGSTQLIIGPVGDRFGKYRMVAIMSTLATILTLFCALAPTLTTLAVARLMTGAAAGWLVPLSLAYIGDVIPYAQRQQILGRYITGQISGQLFGQAMGGILGDLMGWRNVFVLLALMFAVATVLLIIELIRNPITRAPINPNESSRGLVKDYATVLSNRWAVVVIAAVFVEAAFVWGVYAYVGADLHKRFDLSLTAIGLIVACFGLGGFAYVVLVKTLVRRLGQRGLAAAGGILLGAAFLVLALGFHWWIAPLATAGIGLGFYMLHNTLQTNATQMVPAARGTAVAIFSSALYIGQSAGAAVGALVIDRFGAVPLFAGSVVALPALGLWFAYELKRRNPD